MPTSTTDQENEKLNPARNVGQDDFDKKIDQSYGPRDQASTPGSTETRDSVSDNLSSRENDAASGSSSDNFSESSYLQGMERSGDAGWKDSTSPTNSSSTKSIDKFKAAISRGKLIYATIGLSLAVLGLLFSFLIGALGIVQLKESLVAKMSQRGADILERRKNKIMAKKFAKNVTSGCTIKIKCRYKGFSNREIKKFNKRTEKAGLGYRIVPDGRNVLGKNKIKIEQYDTNDTSENPKTLRTISPENFRETVRNDANFRKAFNGFYKGNVEYHAGRAGSFVLAKYKIYRGKIKAPTSDGTEEDKNKRSLRQMVRRAVSGSTGQLEANRIATGSTDPAVVEEERASDIIGEDVRNEIEADIQKEQELVEDFDKNGDLPAQGGDEEKSRFRSITDKIKEKGGGIGGFIGNPLASIQGMCMVRMIAAASASGRSVLQTVQLMKFSGLFIVLADQIKAGDGDEDTMRSLELLMGMLSKKDERGFTAFDSLGYNWVMSPEGVVAGTPNEDVGRYQNGGYAPGALGSVVTSVSSSSTLKNLCKVAMSKTVTAISIGLSFGGFSAIFKGGVTAAMKEFVKEVVEKGVKKKIDDVIDKEAANTVLKRTLVAGASMHGAQIIFNYGLPRIIGSLSKLIAGTVVTGDEVGVDAGNALVSGFGATVAQTSKAQGMMPLNPDRAVATDNLAYSNQLKLAREDGINQFDVTNRFSFASQFASNILPVQAKFSSLTSLPSALSNMSSSALKVAFSKSAYAATDKRKQYTYCTDIDEIYNEKNIATDPMCNPIYGLPSAVKDIDPEVVTDYLLSQGLIDQDGNPQPDFTTFINDCLQSQTPYGENDNCLKGGGLEPRANYLSEDDKKYAMMRLYCLDSSVDVDMNDGEGISCAPEIQSSNVNEEEAQTDASEEIDPASLYEPSDNIACAPGTKDLGVVDDAYHAGNKFKARLCAVEGVPETGDLSDIPGSNGKLVVNSRVSAVIVKMVTDAKNDGVNPITAAEGFRSMARQTQLYRCKPGCGVGSNPVASPGTSNHQAGLAIDWNEPMNGWLRSKGEKYGYKWFGPDDAPHFSPDGR